MHPANILAPLAMSVLTSTAAAQPLPDTGLLTVESTNSASETVKKLEAAIAAKGMKVFARIDHAAAATEAGLAMPYSTLVVFGAPKAGTPNFLKQPTLAIDLPLKALVWQDSAGKVHLTYNTGAYVLGTIFPRHGLNPPMKAQQAQEAMLSGLAAVASK